MSRYVPMSGNLDANAKFHAIRNPGTQIKIKDKCPETSFGEVDIMTQASLST